MKRFAARVEFIAVREEIKNLLGTGYGIKLAHKKLVGEGRITMSYRTFYGYVRRQNKQPAQIQSQTQPVQFPVSSGQPIMLKEDEQFARRLGVANSKPIIGKMLFEAPQTVRILC